MSAQWRGLHNPDTHGTTSDGEPYCESCGVCDEGWRCRCCLAAEVEALRAQVQAVRALCQSARVSISKGCLCYGDECSGTCGRGKPMGWNLNPDDILRALDGDA